MSDLDKLTVPALKKKCKECGVAQTGEKPDLLNRLKLHAKGEAAKLDGVNPSNLKAGELKKALATRGLPCSLDLESRDVLVERLIDALKKENPGAAGGAASAGGGHGDGGGNAEEEAMALAVDIAKQVLQLGEAGDAAGVLSLLGAKIDSSTPFAQQRKAYLQLSRMIHPDKLSRHFDGATRAFQELVRAFDDLTKPPAPTDEGVSGKNKQTTISRSNDGCFKTKIFCPRCDAEWFMPDSGLQNYDYNLMMQGLKLYCCALCLCEFGCVSARHRCPHCYGHFAYHPKDYHRHVACGNKKCNKSGATFGFMLYHIPARVEADLRVQIKEEQEKRLKNREASMARQARAARKAPALTDEARQKQAEQLFLRGLIDACPRCGFEAPKGAAAEDVRRHLSECTDAKAHAAHRQRVQQEEAARAAKASVKEAESEAQNLAAWQFLGASTEQMWLLTDTQLKKQVEERGITLAGGGGSGGSGAPSREELLVALAKDQKMREQQRKQQGLGRITASASAAGSKATSSGAAGSSESSDQPVRIRAESLPSNLHTMSLSQLKSVCAAHGLLAKGDSTSAVIAEIEAALYKDTDAAPLLLEGGGSKRAGKAKAAKPAAGSSKAKPVVIADDSSDDDVPLSKKARQL